MNFTILDCRLINCLKGLSELFIFRRTPYSVKNNFKRIKMIFRMIHVVGDLQTSSLIIVLVL